MILSTSDTTKNIPCLYQNFYLILSIFWFIFAIIYEHFSHGVYSLFMQLCFLFPLLGGFILSWLLSKLKLPQPSYFIQHLYICGLMTLNIGSCMRGIFDISGVATNLLFIYIVVGLPILLFAMIKYLFDSRKILR